MNNLNLCKDHKQEWKQSEYAKENCDYCKLLVENKQLREYITNLQDFCDTNHVSKNEKDVKINYVINKNG